MTDLAVEFKLLDCFVERHAVIPPHGVYTATFLFYRYETNWQGCRLVGSINNRVILPLKSLVFEVIMVS